MSKILRQTAQIFGSNAGLDEIEEFGSLAGGTPVYVAPNATNAVETIQSLSAWLEGWFGGVVGSNLPAIEDMNAVAFVLAYQVAYMMQSGIPEWDSGTTYYTGSLVTGVGTGIIYRSLIDNNTNNAVSTSDWAVVGSSNIVDVNGAGGTTALTAANNGQTIIVNTSSMGQTYTLPSPFLNCKIKIKDNGNAQTNNIIINPHASETIDGLSSITMSFNYGWVELTSDGTNWYITDQSANISAWTSYTPSGSSGFGTISSFNLYYRRVRDTMEIQGTLIPGTPSGTSATIQIPGSLITPSYYTNTSENIVGTFTGLVSSAWVLGNITIGGTSSDISFIVNGGTASASGNQIATSGSAFGIIAKLAIQGWTSY